jgi:hypothetical protein
MCHDAYKFPEVDWLVTADGVSRATVAIGASTYTNEHGTFTTRSLNNKIPGALMRMEVRTVNFQQIAHASYNCLCV